MKKKVIRNSFFTVPSANVMKTQFGTLSFKDFDIAAFAEKYLLRPVKNNNTQ